MRLDQHPQREPPPWWKCLLGQFHMGTFGRIEGPPWFYLLLFDLFPFFYGTRNPLGYWAGGLILIGVLICAAQETRRRRGIPLPEQGWWTFTAALLVLASGLLFVVDGVVNGNMESLALGLVVSVVLIFLLLLMAVLRRGEEKKK